MTLNQDRLRGLMLAAIHESTKSVEESEGTFPKVGTVLASPGGEIIAQAHRGELADGGHAEQCLLQKIQGQSLDLKNCVLFVTLEPCTVRGPGEVSCADRILRSGIGTVYIGMLDTNIDICGRGETLLRGKDVVVERFPSDLVAQIGGLNADFVRLHGRRQVPTSSVFVKKQIPAFVADELRRDGIDLDEIPGEWDVTIDDVVGFCAARQPGKTRALIDSHVRRARGVAFDKKYGSLDYSNDARGVLAGWQEDVRSVFRVLKAPDFLKRRIVNVGIGNGHEADGLWDNAEHLTIIDAAARSLEAAGRRLPSAMCFRNDAEALTDIDDGSQDVYVSLRAFQSTYFGDRQAVREAYRVVRQGGLVVISIANGFVGEGGSVVPGLVLPGTNISDRDRPFALADRVRRHLELLRFEEIGVRSGLTEVFVYGRKTW